MKRRDGGRNINIERPRLAGRGHWSIIAAEVRRGLLLLHEQVQVAAEGIEGVVEVLPDGVQAVGVGVALT